jgi:hypothetical protein
MARECTPVLKNSCKYVKQAEKGQSSGFETSAEQIFKVTDATL